MYYLGIDIGKYTHVASLMNEEAALLLKAFSFSNTVEGTSLLLEQLPAHAHEIEVGLEATGHYWLSLYSFLVEKGFVVHVLNPIQIDGWRQGMEIRKRKTDSIDSVLIADFIRYGTFLESSLADEDTMSLRNLSRFRNYLVSSIGDLKRKTICILDQVFPEYASHFSDIFRQTSEQVLLHLSTPSDFEAISSDQLDEILSQISKKQFAKRKIQQLSDSAKTSFGVTF